MIFLCCIVAGGVLKLTSAVVLPFSIALLLAFVTYPVIKGLEKLHFPRFLSIFVIVMIIIAGMYIFTMVLFTSGKTIVSYYHKIESRLTEIYIWIATVFELSYSEDLNFLENLWAQLGVRTWVRQFTFTFSNFFFQFIRNAVLIVLFMAFILTEASTFKEKLEAALEDRSDRIDRMGHDIMNQVSRYLAAKFFISVANGLVVAIPLYFVGLEFAVIWGILQFVLNFIPTLGSIAAGVIVSLFALIQFWPEPGPIILVILIMLGANMIIGNILDPKIIGEHVGISPLMVLVSLMVWGFIWGFAGMVVAVPMMVIIKIVCENIPILAPVSILIGSRKAVKAKKAEAEKAET
jgi:predicted PurR-regulated permease PerM